MLVAFVVFSQGAALAQSVPADIFTDPPPDKAHRAKMTVVHIPTHGLPCNEKNLDLAQATRRADWNAVTFNYRGSWGSPSSFRFAQSLEDAAAVLEYLRKPSNAAALGIDTRRIMLAGHSMGGWVTAMTASKNSALSGAIISAADMGRQRGTRGYLVAEMADDMESLVGVTPQGMADEITSHAKAFSIGNAAQSLSKLPLLVITSDDGLAPGAAALVKAIEEQGGKNVKTAHFATDHTIRIIGLHSEAKYCNGWPA